VIVNKLIAHIPRQQYEDLDKSTARLMKDAPAA
jgi:hypothetical protein